MLLKKRNKVGLSFLDGLTEDHASLLTKCVALEQIYSINSPYSVAPFPLQEMFCNIKQHKAVLAQSCMENLELAVVIQQ